MSSILLKFLEVSNLFRIFYLSKSERQVNTFVFKFEDFGENYSMLRTRNCLFWQFFRFILAAVIDSRSWRRIFLDFR